MFALRTHDKCCDISIDETNKSDVKNYVGGVPNATQKSYADHKTAEAVRRGMGQLVLNGNSIKLSESSGSDEDEGSLVAGMGSVSL